MMREILFRGKRKDNGEWIVGHLLKYEDGRARINESHTDIFCYEKDRSIIQTVAHEVVPETVGQYTGLEDKNGKQIFEGDIVKSSVSLHVSEVYFSHGKFTLKCKCHGGGLLDICGDVLKVIGNIHDNPKLLEVVHE